MSLDDLTAPAPRDRLDVRGAGGVRLNVEVYGPDDAPTVVLVHGWTCSIGFWARQLNDLGRDLRLVAVDQRGHGASGRPADPGDGYSTAAIADDLAAVLDAGVPAGRRAVVVGHSMGAMTLMAMSERHPDRFRRQVAAAVLASTAMRETVLRSRVLPLPPPLARVAHPLTARLLAVHPPGGRVNGGLRSLVRYSAMSRGAGAAEVDFCTRIVAACPRPVRSGFARTLAALDLDPLVADFDVPTLVVAGTHDRLTPIGHARALALALPRPLGLLELAGAGHMTPVERPAEVGAAIRALVRDHLAAPPDRTVDLTVDLTTDPPGPSHPTDPTRTSTRSSGAPGARKESLR